jgi:hypothetical protein
LRLLLDTCVWGGAVERLRSCGHDVFWSGNLSPDPGDEAILQQALEEQRILVPSLSQAEAIHSIVVQHGELLADGAIITVKNQRLRVRRPLPQV